MHTLSDAPPRARDCSRNATGAFAEAKFRRCPFHSQSFCFAGCEPTHATPGRLCHPPSPSLRCRQPGKTMPSGLNMRSYANRNARRRHPERKESGPIEGLATNHYPRIRRAHIRVIARSQSCSRRANILVDVCVVAWPFVRRSQKCPPIKTLHFVTRTTPMTMNIGVIITLNNPAVPAGCFDFEPSARQLAKKKATNTKGREPKKM